MQSLPLLSKLTDLQQIIQIQVIQMIKGKPEWLVSPPLPLEQLNDRTKEETRTLSNIERGKAIEYRNQRQCG